MYGRALLSFAIKDFRSFSDSGRIIVGDIMVLLGANSAGKSTVVTVLRMLKAICSSEDEPDFKELPELASFDSVVRKQWSKKQSRPQTFQISAMWGLARTVAESSTSGPLALSDGREHFYCQTNHTFCRHPILGGTMLQSIRYITNLEGLESVLVERGEDPPSAEPRLTTLFSQGLARAAAHWSYRLTLPNGSTYNANLRGVSFELDRDQHPGDEENRQFAQLENLMRVMRLVSILETLQPHRVVAPERPKPRSYYVLDDPSFTESERTFIEELMVAWFKEKESASKSPKGASPAERIREALKVLGLVKHFGVKRSKTAGPEIVNIEVSTSSGREMVALSDVGFGVSQILPLIVKESLSEGTELIVYQPEVHLHPTAQSKLADFFVGAWRRGNRSVIETHSTYLIMRLQALVALKEVPQDIVEVLCVEREGTESKVKKMEFDELGRPKDKWPKGFVDTSAVLAEELNNVRLAQRKK